MSDTNYMFNNMFAVLMIIFAYYTVVNIQADETIWDNTGECCYSDHPDYIMLHTTEDIRKDVGVEKSEEEEVKQRIKTYIIDKKNGERQEC